MNGLEKEKELLGKYGRNFSRPDVIFYEGDQGEEMFILQTGKVKVSKRIGDIQKTLAILEKGEFFGEMAILNNKPRSATVEVIEDAFILVIDRKTFETMIRNNVEIALRMIKKMSGRLQEADYQIELLLIRDEMQRIVYFLTRQVQNHGIETRDVLRIELDYSPIEFAGLVGLTLSSVTRCMDKLVKGGFIAFKEGNIVIPRKKHFQELVKFLELRDRFTEFV